MADTFRNPYSQTSPIGAALADLTRVMLSGPSRAEKITAAENMLKIKRANENLLKAQTIIGTPGYDQNAFAAAALGGGVSGGDAGDYTMLTQDPNAAWDDQALNNAYIRTGGAPTNTAGAFKFGEANDRTQAANTLAETNRNNVATLAQDQSQFNVTSGETGRHNLATEGETARQFNQNPYVAIGDSGMPEVFTNLDAIGRPANVPEANMRGALIRDNFPNLDALTQRQAAVLGAEGTGNPPRAKMYVLPNGDVGRTTDDRTDMVTGQPLPVDARLSDITDSSDTFEDSELAKRRGEILQKRQAVENIVQQSNNLRGLLSQPNADAAAGFLGAAAGTVNGWASQAQAALRLAGVEEPAEVRSAETYLPMLQQLGIQNAVTGSALVDLAYTYAEDRDGDGQKSVDDVAQAMRTIGASLGDPVAMQAVVLEAAKRALKNYASYEGTVRGMYGDRLNVGPAQFSPLDGAAPPAPAPTAAPIASAVTISSDEEYNALPPGTLYTAPDGSTRRKP